MTKQPEKISQLATAQKVVVLVLMIASMTNAMGAAAVAPALPSMSAAFPSVSATVIAWVITLPNLAMALFSFFSGAIADKIGKTVTLVCASIVFTISGLAAMFMGSIEPILVCRFILGIGIAGLSVSTTALIAELYHGHLRASILSLQSAFGGIGVFVLETSGGALASFGWRVPFLVYLIGIIILLGAVVFLRESKLKESHEAALADRKNAAGVGHVIPKRQVLITVTGTCLVMFVMQFCMFSFPGRLPYYVVEQGGDSFLSGLVLGVNGLSMTACSLWQARAVRRFPRYVLIPLGFAMTVIGFVGLWLSDGIALTTVFAIFGGGGQGIIMASSAQWISTVATPQTSGKVMGAFSTSLNLAAFACSLVVELIRDVTGSLSGMFGFFGIVMAVVLVVLLAIGRKVIK